MTKGFLLGTMCLVLFACGNRTTNNANDEAARNEKDRVEILYFHGKQRCATCKAIEANAKEAIDARFADELKRGDVVFRIVDISRPENERIAEKYEVTWSSLILVKHAGGKEQVENLTEFAFGNARTAPEEFKKAVAEKVTALLK
ncbi:MAG: nitrophenyl compound nitroreductase subunit ArsF family protein [Alistipes sp.]|nr:nitrophenyl compound nitroreductase subunit ArsF family protein [Alistipes senegalensis]MCM1250508.1 nitrophenyl compound nitroreductase subunit ArsF family protein [Alistipes sp.]